MRARTFSAAMLAALLAALATLAAGPAAAAGGGPKDNDTYLQLLAFNDFHGHVEANTPGSIQVGQTRDPSTGAVVNQFVRAGGAEYLATHVKGLRLLSPNTITVGSGDLIGASPLLSGLFHDEPAIEALNEVGLDISGVGNHEFDEGLAELYRIIDGGCHPVDGCQDGTPYFGSAFGYLAANVVFEGTEDTILPAYEIRKVGNAKIAFIGLTLEGTPLIVTPSGVAGLEFRDEVETVNALVQKLRNENGVRAFVVLLHQGGFQNRPFSNADPAQGLSGWPGINNCDNMGGAIVDIANGLSDQVDVIISGHTHAQYICAGANEIDGKVVTSASSFGRLVTDVDLVISHETKDVKSKTARNVIVTQDVAKDPAVSAILAHYKAIADPIANRVVGSVSETLLSARDSGGDPDGDGEAPLGNVIADAQLEATAPSDFGGAVIAFMNPGGIRAPIRYDQISGGEQPGEVTYGELFTVQPFGNTLVVKTCTGAQIQQLLEQQLFPGKILTVSRGFNYTWDAARPAGDKVIDSSVTLNGNPIVDAQNYRVEMNSFLADGGDGFSVFAQCTDQLGGEVDLDALVRYFQAHSPISPPAENRITRLN
ncbi:MAG: bifunctional metallophosphatase/5'-nucleotidase [Actinomycetota bacterium]|nr:bifunctional metallophosphatase/5'-nucleotidase [Actinomycetota bacterium]